MKLENPTRLRSDINFLKKFAEGEISEECRRRYQNLIGELGLLRQRFPVEDKYRERLYDALLRLAFGTPLSYKAYCTGGEVRGRRPRCRPVTSNCSRRS